MINYDKDVIGWFQFAQLVEFFVVKCGHEFKSRLYRKPISVIA